MVTSSFREANYVYISVTILEHETLVRSWVRIGDEKRHYEVASPLGEILPGEPVST